MCVRVCVCVCLPLSLSILSLSVCPSPPRSFFPRAGTLASCCNFARISLVCNCPWTWDSCKMCQFSVRLLFLYLFFFIFSVFFFLSLSLSLRNAMREVGKWGRARGTCNSANLRKSHLGLGLALFRQVDCVSLQCNGHLGIVTYFWRHKFGPLNTKSWPLSFILFFFFFFNYPFVINTKHVHQYLM